MSEHNIPFQEMNEAFIKASEQILYSRIRSDTEYHFFSLKQKLDARIIKHLDDMNFAFKHKLVKHDAYGGLSYIGKTLYLVESTKSTNEPSNSSVNKNYIAVITPSPLEDPSEQYQGYEFFMFRLINGENSFNTGPEFKITFDEQSNESYKKSDVVGAFKYFDANRSMIKAYSLERDTSTAKPNPIAEKILGQEKNHLIDIIKSVFNENHLHCNKLKNIPDNLITEVCTHTYDSSGKDYTIQFMNCNEIFTLARSDELCPYHDSLDNSDTNLHESVEI